MKRNIGHIDWFILLPTVALMFFSIAFVYSASAYYAEYRGLSDEFFFHQHALRIFVGLAIMIVFAKIDYHIWQKISKPFIIISLVLLVLVLFSGFSAKGASRWINLGFMKFQPSELAKFALILHLAVLLTKKQERIKDIKQGLLPLLIWVAATCFLIAIQPNMSTTMIIFLIALSMMFIGNANVLHLGSIALGSMFLGAVYAALVTKYPLQRIKAFLGMSNPDSSRLTHQADQALIAFGNGGLFGVGPGHSRQSYLFLPESYGDFIYSIIGEEYGFMGAILVIAAFVIILWRGFLVAKKSPDLFGYFLASGILFAFAFYTVVNAGVNTGLLPTTGLPMPFISYGGTAVFFYSAAMGILLNISSQAGVYPRKVINNDSLF